MSEWKRQRDGGYLWETGADAALGGFAIIVPADSRRWGRVYLWTAVGRNEMVDGFTIGNLNAAKERAVVTLRKLEASRG